MVNKICENCGKDFESIRTTARFCSRECFKEFIVKQMGITTRTTAENRIEISLSLNNKLTIAFIADVHNNFVYLQETVNEILEHPDWVVVINGDLWDAEQYSTHPTEGKVMSLKESVQEAIRIMRPIFPQMIAFVWGNHEERCFRAPSGKGTMPSYFDVFFEAWKTVNPQAQICDPMKSLLISVNGKYRILVKHGKSAGKNFGVMEWRDVLTVNEDIDVFVLSHGHIPELLIVKRPTIEDPRKVYLVRTTAGVEFLPYQDKANMFIAPAGLTRITFDKDGILQKLLKKILGKQQDIHVDLI